MTAFEPVLAACNAYKSKRVSASSCVDYSSATSIHSSAIILKQVSSRLHKMTCHAALSLYHCSFHSPTQNLTRLVLLNELHRICSIVVCCVPLQALVLKGCVCTLVSSFRIFDGRLAVCVKDNVTLPLCAPTYSTMDKTDSASCANVLLLPFILCTRPIPSMMQVD